MTSVFVRVRLMAAISVSIFPLMIGAAIAADKRPINLDDMARIVDVSDPQVSPDGQWVAYTARTSNVAKDKRARDVWMSSWKGDRSIRLTTTDDNESRPKWSPDGRYLAFLSSRCNSNDIVQLWLLAREGGEAIRVTEVKGSVEDYAFSPDGKRVALIIADEDPQAAKPKDGEEKTKPPIVIDRFYFKEDGTGYLGKLRKHLSVLDLATRAIVPLTPGPFDEMSPAWSPDGTRIAFVSKRTGDDPDRNDTYGIYVIEPRAGATPRLVTTYQGAGGDSEFGGAPAWSPDGTRLAFVGGGDPKLIYYAVFGIAVVSAEGGTPTYLTRSLDRNTDQPVWSADGRSLYFLIEDNGNQHIARIPAQGGAVTRLTTGRRDVSQLTAGPGNKIAVLQSTVDRPNEVFVLDGKNLRQLSRQNDAWLSAVQLADVEEIRAKSRDGTDIGGFLLRPIGYQTGQKVPTILRIHGGPVSQFSNSFSLEWQLLAANGYAVIAGNPRGSSGRGEAFSSAIYADWGNKDVDDVLALVDAVVARGIADANRLGVGGWSYGGMLTNYVITKDSRFKAATSGASIANAIAGYGTDMYIREYEMELGVPWKNLETWQRISFPFLQADRIRTPTLFLCGDADFNVPLLNSEQMYQALRSQNVPTQLIIYPGQTHGLAKPSYLRDRMQRYLDWYKRYLGS
jgi:dipeptidyl aminopeptidase/acylaminoacyl peptidase